MRNVLPLCLVLAACSSEQPIASTFNAQARADAQAAREGALDNRAISAGFTPAQPAPIQTTTVDPAKASAPGAILPPEAMQYRYIGRWAPSVAACASAAWKFETRKLSNAGDASCDLPTVAAVRSSYELQGTCKVKGRTVPQTLKLTFDEAARRMRVDSAALGSTNLLYCGD